MYRIIPSGFQFIIQNIETGRFLIDRFGKNEWVTNVYYAKTFPSYYEAAKYIQTPHGYNPDMSNCPDHILYGSRV